MWWSGARHEVFKPCLSGPMCKARAPFSRRTQRGLPCSSRRWSIGEGAAPHVPATRSYPRMRAVGRPGESRGPPSSRPPSCARGAARPRHRTPRGASARSPPSSMESHRHAQLLCVCSPATRRVIAPAGGQGSPKFSGSAGGRALARAQWHCHVAARCVSPRWRAMSHSFASGSRHPIEPHVVSSACSACVVAAHSDPSAA